MSRKLIVTAVFGFAVTIFGATVLVGNTYAADGSQNITVSPASAEISLNAGSSVTKSFDVINDGNDAYKVSASVSPYHVEGENYDPQFTQLPGTTNVTSWITLSGSNFTVQPNKLATVSYTVTIPKGTQPGGYYAVLFAETSPITTGAGVVAHNRVGHILYITVNGNVKTSGLLSSTKLKSLVIGNAVPIDVKISNTGGVHFISNSVISVKSFSGQQVYKNTLQRYVLPQTVRQVAVSWQPSSPVGIYTISRNATVAGSNQTLPDQTIVFVKPWVVALFFAFVVVLGVVIIMAVSLRKRKSKPGNK